MEDTLWEKAYSHLTEIYGAHPPLEILERFEKDNGEILVKSGISYMDMIADREDLFWLIQEKMYQRNIYSTAIAFQMMTLCQKGQWYQEKMHASTKTLLEEIGIDAWQIGFLTQIRYLFPKGHMINILCNRLEALHSNT